MRARKILLLIGILLFGAMIEGAWRAREQLGVGATGWRILSGRFHGPSHRFQAEEVRGISQTSLSVKNEFGAVRVSPGEPGEIRVRMEKRVYVARESEAEEFAARVALVWSEEGDTLQLRTNRDELLSGPGRDVGFETTLEIQVPPETRVRISGRHGDLTATGIAGVTASNTNGHVTATEIRGAVELQNRDGDVEVTGAEGPVTVSNRHGDVRLQRITGAVEAHVLHGGVSGRDLASLSLQHRDGAATLEGVTGELQLRGSHASVALTDSGGDVDVQTTYAPVTVDGARADVRVENRHGRVEVKRVGGGVAVKARDGDVELEDVTGRVVLEVRDGELRARELRGGASVEAWDRRVELERFAGPVEIRSRDAEVVLIPQLPVTESVRVTGEDALIELRVPGGSRFDLEAQSSRGRVEVELPDLALDEERRDAIRARIGGGGAAVSLKSEKGDIRVVAGESSES